MIVVTVQPRTLHCAAKSVRICRGWDASSHHEVVFTKWFSRSGFHEATLYDL